MCLLISNSKQETSNTETSISLICRLFIFFVQSFLLCVLSATLGGLDGLMAFQLYMKATVCTVITH